MQNNRVTLGIAPNNEKMNLSSIENKKESLKKILDLSKINNENDDYLELAYEKIKVYIEHDEKFLYSIISSYVHNLTDDEELSLIFFIEELVIYSENIEDKNKSVNKSILKLWDHINLVICQEGYVNNNFNGYVERRNILESRMVDSENLLRLANQNHDDISNKVENITTQLISLVAIFTALSFVLFGGIASFQSIFSNLESVSILKLIPISLIWALGMINLIFVFIYYISKISKGEIKTQKNGKTIFTRYPMILLVNCVLITLFVISVWIYGFQQLFGFKLLNNSVSLIGYVLGGILVLSAIFISLIYILKSNE